MKVSGHLSLYPLYTTAEAMKAFILSVSLRKKIQIWLPDLKYGQEYCAVRYSQAPNYFDTACRAIEEM